MRVGAGYRGQGEVNQIVQLGTKTCPNIFSITVYGVLFHSTTVRGKKEFLSDILFLHQCVSNLIYY